MVTERVYASQGQGLVRASCRYGLSSLPGSRLGAAKGEGTKGQKLALREWPVIHHRRGSC